jgi:hypothetical protein
VTPVAFIACPPALMPFMSGMASLTASGPATLFGIYGIYQEAYRRAWWEVQARTSMNGTAEPVRTNVFAVGRGRPRI